MCSIFKEKGFLLLLFFSSEVFSQQSENGKDDKTPPQKTQAPNYGFPCTVYRPVGHEKRGDKKHQPKADESFFWHFGIYILNQTSKPGGSFLY